MDFFTPIVNDPYWFGQIAATNALSDIYAMGAIPKTAMNIVCFSPKKFGKEVLKEIIRGGADKLKEAEASLLGGHSVDDDEIKYGLSVTGIVHPKRIIKNEGAQPGDYLIITKPLGTGILNTAIKAGILKQEAETELIGVMATLNKKASEVMLTVRVHAATDVTGFGLAGHLMEMIKESVGIELYGENIPYFLDAPELVATGILPGGLYRNRDFYKRYVEGKTEGFLYDIIFDPQTSGGILMAIHPDDLDKFKENAAQYGLNYWIIGRFVSKPEGRIVIT